MISIVNDDRVKLVSDLVPVIVGKNSSVSINVLIMKDLVVFNVNNTCLILANVNIGAISNIYKDDIAYNYRMKCVEENQCYYDDQLELHLKNMYNSYCSSINIQNMVASNSNLISSNDQMFTEMVGMKASDGCRFYKMLGNNLIKSYMVPFFSGFPIINKNDDISISLYKAIEPNSIIVYESIFKKKINQTIYFIFRILDIC